MKKFFTILLTLVFMLSMGSAVFATQPDTSKTLTTGEIPKSFTVSPLSTNPAETFTFKFTQQIATTNTNLQAVVIPDTLIAYTAGQVVDTATALKNGSISLAAFSAVNPLVPVGRYTYDVTEILPAPLTAGLTYTTRTGTLVVDKETNGTVKPYLIIGTVGSNTALKFENFDNSFAAGNLSIAKTVTGNLGDQTKLFEVTVSLTAPAGKIVKDDLIKLLKPDTTSSVIDFTDGADNTATVKFQVKHGETFTIENLPYGVTYAVVETDPLQGYTVTYVDTFETTTDGAGAINAAMQTVGITNHKSSEIPTGISLDSLPYILLLIAAVAGMGVLVLKKRKHTDF